MRPAVDVERVRRTVSRSLPCPSTSSQLRRSLRGLQRARARLESRGWPKCAPRAAPDDEQPRFTVVDTCATTSRRATCARSGCCSIGSPEGRRRVHRGGHDGGRRASFRYLVGQPLGGTFCRPLDSPAVARELPSRRHRDLSWSVAPRVLREASRNPSTTSANALYADLGYTIVTARRTLVATLRGEARGPPNPGARRHRDLDSRACGATFWEKSRGTFRRARAGPLARSHRPRRLPPPTPAMRSSQTPEPASPSPRRAPQKCTLGPLGDVRRDLRGGVAEDLAGRCAGALSWVSASVAPRTFEGSGPAP
jgi:hypothetical protein